MVRIPSWRLPMEGVRSEASCKLREKTGKANVDLQETQRVDKTRFKCSLLIAAD